ncbi:hypothetical protein F2Q69_00023655 [Brassica cretica]|uniref:Tyrosine specific protein phosphatases domain-containing protein n=1 Tax=Brassica cretica TaxID=69181 RepID=A0A8S9QDF7_BRACR|nr:hypothetical protein F2Q69_00023655 [Brassica cretica]
MKYDLTLIDLPTLMPEDTVLDVRKFLVDVKNHPILIHCKAGNPLGIAQHHDCVTGTAKQYVANDYAKRLALAASEDLPTLMPEDTVLDVRKFLVDVKNHPILIHCKARNHRTSCSLSGYDLAARQLNFLVGKKSGGPNTFSLCSTMIVSLELPSSNWFHRLFPRQNQ